MICSLTDASNNYIGERTLFGRIISMEFTVFVDGEAILHSFSSVRDKTTEYKQHTMEDLMKYDIHKISNNKYKGTLNGSDFIYSMTHNNNQHTISINYKNKQTTKTFNEKINMQMLDSILYEMTSTDTQYKELISSSYNNDTTK